MVIPVASLSRATEMWKNVKALEEENQRLRKEVREWVNKALELSKRLHASGMAVNSVAQMHARFKSARTAGSDPAAQTSESTSSASSSSGRAANDSRFPQASSDVSGGRESRVLLASERPSEPSTAR